MESLRKFAIILSLAYFVCETSKAQWVSLDPYVMEGICAVASIDTTLFVSDFDRVWATSDRGATWDCLINDVDSTAPVGVRELIPMGEKLFAISAYGNPLSSIDKGRTWRRCVFPDNAQSTYTLGHNGKLVWAGTSNGVYFSSDSGVTWILRNEGLKNLAVSRFANLGSSVIAGSSDGVYLWSDGDASWKRIFALDQSIGGAWLGPIAVVDSCIFVAWSEHLIRSSDRGMNWTELKPPGNLQLCSYGHYLFVSSGGGLFRSTDLGASWNVVDVPRVRILCLQANEQSLFVGGDYGWLSAIDGLTMTLQMIHAGIGTEEIRTLIKRDGAIFASAISGLYRSTDMGSTWTYLGPSAAASTSLVSVGSYLFAGGGWGLKRSADNGLTWKSVTQGLPDTIAAYLGVASNTLFASQDYHGVYRSTDFGESWVSCTAPIPDMRATALAGKDSVLFVGSWEMGVFRTDDFGKTWINVTGDLPNPGVLHIRTIAVSGDTVFLGTGNGVFASVDSGKHWTQLGARLSGVEIISFAASNGLLMAGTSGSGVYTSWDGGTTWYRTIKGIGSSWTEAILIDPPYCYAGNNSNSTRRLISDLKSEDENYPASVLKVLSPSQWNLQQNFPNPFNPSTTMRFSIPSRSRVRLTIFNLLGQQIAELANEEMNVGSHERTWNANVASGMYFYRIEAVSVNDPTKRFVDVKKMVLVR